MEHIAVSVIVPIYNTKPFLEECIQSILDQDKTFEPPFEVILVDDGSTDGCGEVCDAFAARDNRVRVIHQENQGLSAARNTGIDAAHGRYYAFVDSDDILRPEYLKKLYDACETHDAYMSVCAVEDVAEHGESLDPPSYTDPTATGVFVGKELLNNFYSPNGTTTPWPGTSSTAPRYGSCCTTPKAACMKTTLWPIACSGGATGWCACRTICTATACAGAASAAPT